MQIVIDTSKLATPFKAIGRGIKRVYHKAKDKKLDLEAIALLRKAEHQNAVQIRAMQLAPDAFGNMMDAAITAADTKPKAAKNRGTSRNKPAAQPRRTKK